MDRSKIVKLLNAYKLADRIKETLSPWCKKIEVAGSIRRARPEVGDIDLVILPKPGCEHDIRNRIKAQTTVVSDGHQTLIVRLSNGVQIDTWFAHHGVTDLLDPQPSNWGTLLMCRTGSRQHNIFICQKAAELGLHWDPHRGVRDGSGRILAAEEEKDVFLAVGLAWIPPALRER